MAPRRRAASVGSGVDSEEEYEFEELGSESEYSSEDEGHREWNAYCEACGGFDDLGAALHCSTCASQYHPDCLTPEQRSAQSAVDGTHAGRQRRAGGAARPAVRWTCPRCTRRTQLGSRIDKILAARGGGMAREYRVKWVQRSYLHTEWVKLSELEEAAGTYPGLRRRLKVFDAKQKAAGTQPDGELVDGVKPAWVEVERVIAERAVGDLAAALADSLQRSEGGGGGRRQFLCKWREQSYAECTWEDEADVAEHGDLIDQFRRRVPICDLQLGTPDRLGFELPAGEDSDPLAQLAQLAEATAGASASQGAPAQRRFTATPDFLQGELHPYQLEGLNWLYQGWQSGTNLILADEMGLGKTVQAIGLLAALAHERVPRPHLVVVPLSTLPNWQREFARFAPQLNVVALSGNAEARAVVKEYELFGHGLGARTINAAGRRREMLQRAVQFHVLLTSYEMVAAEEGDLSKLEFEVLVVDEGHRLKNKEARLFQALQALRLRHRVLLTGTPLQNDLSELFMLLHFLEPQRFHSLDAFQREFEDITHEQQVERLHTLVCPHLLRRMKVDVLRQLPPKKEQIVAVELSPSQKQLYRHILTLSYESLTRGGVSKLKNVMMELRKAVQHVYLQFFPAEPRPTGQAWLQLLLDGSGKLALMDRMLQKLRAQGHRVLIYSQFLLMLDVLEWYCAARGHTYQRLDGSVGTAERQRRIDAFNSQRDRHFLFLLSTRAGGLGVNLQTADTVILYDSDWNPHNDLQAQARAHRLGQESGVMVYRLIARNTVEERMMQRARSKLVLEHVVVHKMKRKPSGLLDGKGAGAGEDSLDKNELQDLVRFGAAELFADDKAEPDLSELRIAAQKAGRPVPTSVAEQQAGRTGGQDGRTVVWTDEAIDKLLDRSAMGEEAAEEAEGAGGSDILAGFKVAHFELKEQPVAELPGAAPGDGSAPGAAAGQAGAEAAAGGAQQLGADAAAAAAAHDMGSLVLDPATGFTAANFWEGLLAGRHAVVQASAAPALGKGKRQRRKLLTLQPDAELDALLRGDSSSDAATDSGGEAGGSGARSQRSHSSDHSDEDFRIGSEEEQEQRAEEEQEAREWEQDGLVPEEKERRRRFPWGQAAADQGPGGGAGQRPQHGAQGPADQQAQQQGGGRPATKRQRRTQAEMAVERGNYEKAIQLTCQGEHTLRPLSGWPLVSGAGDHLRVWGFSKVQRNCFIELLMAHGVESTEGGAVDWALLQHKFSQKDAGDVAKYGELLMGRLMVAGKSNSGVYFGPSDGVPLEALMCGHSPREVLQRVGMLHVLRSAVASLAQPAGDGTPAAGRNLAREGLRTKGGWASFNDVRLMQGVLKHGYGRWPAILDDSSLGLQAPVLAELDSLGFGGEAPKKPGPNATKEQERAYSAALRRRSQWLEARLARLGAALAEDPGAPDPPLLAAPIRFAFYSRRSGGGGATAGAAAAPGPAQHGEQEGEGRKGQGRAPGGRRTTVAELEAAGVDRDRRKRVDGIALEISQLQGVTEESRRRRMQMHYLNKQMSHLSATIESETQEVHSRLSKHQPVDLVRAGRSFQSNLQRISMSSAQLLRVLEEELRGLDLVDGQQGQQAAAQQQAQQPSQQQVQAAERPPAQQLAQQVQAQHAQRRPAQQGPHAQQRPAQQPMQHAQQQPAQRPAQQQHMHAQPAQQRVQVVPAGRQQAAQAAPRPMAFHPAVAVQQPRHAQASHVTYRLQPAPRPQLASGGSSGDGAAGAAAAGSTAQAQAAMRPPPPVHREGRDAAALQPQRAQHGLQQSAGAHPPAQERDQAGQGSQQHQPRGFGGPTPRVLVSQRDGAAGPAGHAADAAVGGQELLPLSAEEQQSADALLADILGELPAASEAPDGLEPAQPTAAIEVAVAPAPERSASTALAALQEAAAGLEGSGGGGATPGTVDGAGARPRVAGSAGRGEEIAVAWAGSNAVPCDQLLVEAERALAGSLAAGQRGGPAVVVEQVWPGQPAPKGSGAGATGAPAAGALGEALQAAAGAPGQELGGQLQPGVAPSPADSDMEDADGTAPMAVEPSNP